MFQYSVHVERNPGVEPEHYAYLAEGTRSSSLEFWKGLLSAGNGELYWCTTI